MSQTKAQLIDNLVSPITGALGSASAPTFSFTTDTNTGIYSPGADQVAISTNGTGRLFIDSNGRLGVGVSSPALRLHASVADATAYTSSSDGNVLRLANTTAGGFCGISFTTEPSAGNAGIASINSFAPSGGDSVIAFSTRQGSTLSEKVRITQEGRLGLGVSSPGVPLDVAGANGSFIRYTSTAAISTVIGDRSGLTGQIGTTTNHALNIISNQVPAITVDTSQRVGIGTSAPSAFTNASPALALVNNNSTAYSATAFNASPNIVLGAGSASGAYNGIRFSSTGNNETSFGVVQEAGGAGAFVFQGYSGTSYFERLRIDSQGRVGIGTTSVNTTLEVQNSSTPIIRVGDGTRHMELRGGSTTQNAAIGTNYNGSFDIIQNGNAAVTIDTSKRVLVGTSSTSAACTALFQGNSSVSTGAGIVRLARNSTPANGETLGELRWSDSGHTNAAFIECYRDGGTWTSGSSQPTRLTFSTTADGAASPTERMRIDSGGTSYFQSTGNTIAALSTVGAGTSTRLYYGSHTASGIAGTVSYTVWTNGNVVNTNSSYGAISDIKLKENIVDANSQWADIKALRIRNYNLKPETGHETHKQLGLIAQEVELVSPGLVSASPDRDEKGNETGEVTKSVAYSVLYMKAVKALQEAMERIEALETKVAALEGA